MPPWSAASAAGSRRSATGRGETSAGQPLEILQDSQPPTAFIDFPTNGMIQSGVVLIDKGAKPVELCRGISMAVEATTRALRAAAKPVKDHAVLSAVARISASNADLGELVAEARGVVRAVTAPQAVPDHWVRRTRPSLVPT